LLAPHLRSCVANQRSHRRPIHAHRDKQAYVTIYFMGLVSVVSAADYLVAFWKKIDHASSDRRDTDRREVSHVLSRHPTTSLPATNQLL
jgi:hypothetical protein